MASEKRKAMTDERPSKKVKSSEKKESTKQEKPTKKSQIAKPHAEDAADPRPALKSILQQEERAFPRGGGSILTPLEHKQIKAEAERDVLLEQDGGPVGDANEDHELFDVTKSAADGKKKRKTERQSSASKDKNGSSSFKIQSLSYKVLVPGSAVLGRVAAITSKDVALALANNLTGYVPITSISERLNSRIEAMLADDEKEEEEEAEESNDIDLKELFYIGQWVRAVVAAPGHEALEKSGNTRRHIELSLEPAAVNGSADAETAVTNSMIQASIRSVEDHGVVMDLGLSDQSVKGFISKKDLSSIYKIEQLQEGQVMLCLVTGKGSNGKVIKLNPNPNSFSVAGVGNKLQAVSDAPSVAGFQPGTAVDILITESSTRGVVGKVMGLLDVSADVVHSGALDDSLDMDTKFKVGTKIKARIIWTVQKDDDSRWIGVSLLNHMLTLTPPSTKLSVSPPAKVKSQALELDQKLSLSAIVENAKVTRVQADRGLFLTLSTTSAKGEDPIRAFAHISQVSDQRIDTLTESGAYKRDSEHKVRVLSYDAIDNLYYVSLKPSTIEQPFLRLEDICIGESAKGTISELKLGGKKGVMGVIVKISDHISGLIPEMHLSDTQLQHPERKFRVGLLVKVRVLSIDLEKRQLRLTAKRSIVEADGDTSIWKDYPELELGMESKGTIINITPSGSVVQFFGAVRAFLPVSEYSEAFIEIPEKHFRPGQTVDVRIISLDSEAQKMKVTCKDDTPFSTEQQSAWNDISPGQLVDGIVTATTVDMVKVEIEGGLQGSIRSGHLVDGSAAKAASAIKRMRVGQKLANMVVLDKAQRSRTLVLTNKPDLIEDAEAGKLIKDFKDVRADNKVRGFIRNIVPEGVYVEFAGNVVGMLPKSQILPELLTEPAFGFRKDQTMKARVIFVDQERQRFSLSLKEDKAKDVGIKVDTENTALFEVVHNPIDPSLKSTADLVLGRITKACISSIKSTQIQVRLADGIQGRIDVSEAFDSWDEISNKKAPLQHFKQNDIIDVKILGIYDARSHRFLPISHRQGKHPVFELSAKRSRIEKSDESLLTLGTVQQGSTYTAFINNHSNNIVWSHLSPNVRAPVSLLEFSNDAGVLQRPMKHFPIGSAIRVTVKLVDLENGRLDLSAKDENASPLTLQTISPGMVLAAKVTKVTERSVNVQLSDGLIGFIPLTEISDDYDGIDLEKFEKNEIVRVCVIEIDLPNKKVFLSMRPSRVLSSSLPVKDSQITSATSLKEGSIVRGFIKRVAEKGVFISLGANVDAMVWITDLSDQYVKDWKSIVEIDQLVKGRVLSIDESGKFIQMSLKASHVDNNYTAPLKISTLEIGAMVTGKVRKVEDFGAFIDIDNTQPRLSGLCHKSEMADNSIADPRKIYNAGDVVKAKVLKVDVVTKRINLGLKASYFSNADDVEEASDEDVVDVDQGGVTIGIDDDIEMDDGVIINDVDADVDVDSDDGSDDGFEEGAMDVDTVTLPKPANGLKTSGFDWTGQSLNFKENLDESGSEAEVTSGKKRKRTKAEIQVDMTGDLDKYGPRSDSDFERQLLGQPNNSGLWVQYMALQLELSEIQKARDIAERALRTMHIRETEEKATIYIAWLNLEVAYGDDERVEEVFKEARERQDPLDMHQKLASIYIDSGKLEKADDIFRRIIGNKTFRASPDVWLNYATFLMGSLDAPDRARELLKQSLGSIPNNEHRALTSKFAALEFRLSNGDAERGRTIFESLMSTWPKWTSGWDTWVDLERSRIQRVENVDAKKEAKEKTRALFDRMAAQKMKKRRAHYVFKRWLEFEESEGSGKQAERVKALAAEFVQKLQSEGQDETED